MIEFENVTRTYGQKVAVDSLNLTISQGQLFAFLGPNGAGKTTTIKMLVGLLRPTSGSVRVCGCHAAHQTREAMRFVGYVPDQPFLYDKLSGREFLRFVGQLRGLPEDGIARRIDGMTELFDLAGFVDDLAETYSHGMKQRLVFAAAMLHEPPVLVLDEPVVGLDPKSVRLVKDLLQQRAAEGTTIFMSTHTLALAEEIADRIGIVDHGRIGFLGTLNELRSTLASHDTSLEQLFLKLTTETTESGQPQPNVA
jgi:ABC-2 type transport system ATP-binding protein